MKFIIVCFAALLAAGTCCAQNEEKTEPRYFRLDFVVKELEGGKVVTARNYFTTVSSQNRENSSIRTGDKVPVPTGSGGAFTFIDVGVNIDSRVVKATDSHLMLVVNADVSSSIPASIPASVPASGAGGFIPPIIRQNRWSANVVVPLKKATTIFSADGASEKRQMQLELTATPLL